VEETLSSGGPETVSSRVEGGVAIIYAGGYLNKINGERTKRECRDRLQNGCRALVINFSDTEIVNSIGVSILLGVIDAAEEREARLCFCNVNNHTAQLFLMLGLARHVYLAPTEEAALVWLNAANAAAVSIISTTPTQRH